MLATACGAGVGAGVIGCASRVAGAERVGLRLQRRWRLAEAPARGLARWRRVETRRRASASDRGERRLGSALHPQRRRRRRQARRGGASSRWRCAAALQRRRPISTRRTLATAMARSCALACATAGGARLAAGGGAEAALPRRLGNSDAGGWRARGTGCGRTRARAPACASPWVEALASALVEQRLHHGVARARRLAAEHGGDDVLAVAADGGDEVEAGGARVAGLDAVGAAIAGEQRVVVAVGVAAVGEGARRRTARSGAGSRPADAAPASACRAPSSSARGSGRPEAFVKVVLRHADLVRLARHQAREVLLRAGDVLGERNGDVVGGLGDQRLDGVEDGRSPRRAPARAWRGRRRRLPRVILILEV